MAYQQLEEINATEINQLMAYTSTISPTFWPMVLFGFCMIAMFGSYFSTKRLTGQGDILGSAMAATFLTSVLAATLFLIPGVINLTTLVICIVITMAVSIAFFTSKERI